MSLDKFQKMFDITGKVLSEVFLFNNNNDAQQHICAVFKFDYNN